MTDSINIGDLDTLIEVRKCVIGTGDKGQKTYSFAHYSNVWAAVDGDINETISNGNLLAGEALEITIYKIPAMTTRWRVIIRNQSYDVIGIAPLSRISPFCRVSLVKSE